MANLNKVFLIGNLTRDPELRYVPSGTAVTTFGMAINRTYTNPAGEKREEVCFVRIVVWGRQAETCNQFLSKGSLIFVEGRLQYRSWESAGEKRNTLEVRADRVQFLGRPKPGEHIPEVHAAAEEVPDAFPEEDADAGHGTDAPSGKGSSDLPF